MVLQANKQIYCQLNLAFSYQPIFDSLLTKVNQPESLQSLDKKYLLDICIKT